MYFPEVRRLRYQLEVNETLAFYDHGVAPLVAVDLQLAKLAEGAEHLRVLQIQNIDPNFLKSEIARDFLLNIWLCRSEFAVGAACGGSSAPPCPKQIGMTPSNYSNNERILYRTSGRVAVGLQLAQSVQLAEKAQHRRILQKVDDKVKSSDNKNMSTNETILSQ